MASSILNSYLGQGLLANRPVTPNVAPGTAAIYVATDVGKLFTWTGSGWIEGTGSAGADGADGVGISSAIIEDGDLILSYTNGSTVNVGPVVGPAGPAGATGPTGATGPAGVGVTTPTSGDVGRFLFASGTASNQIIWEDPDRIVNRSDRTNQSISFVNTGGSSRTLRIRMGGGSGAQRVINIEADSSVVISTTNFDVNATSVSLGSTANLINIGGNLYPTTSGLAGQVLTSNGSGQLLSWETPTGGGGSSSEEWLVPAFSSSNRNLLAIPNLSFAEGELSIKGRLIFKLVGSGINSGFIDIDTTGLYAFGGWGLNNTTPITSVYWDTTMEAQFPINAIQINLTLSSFPGNGTSGSFIPGVSVSHPGASSPVNVTWLPTHSHVKEY